MSDAVRLKLLSYFPEISPEWLLTGDGEMLVKPSVQPTAGHTQQANGNGNVVTQTMQSSAALDRAFSEIAEMRKLVQEQVRISQEQTAHLLSVIEKLAQKGK